MKADKYTYRVAWSEEDGEYAGTVAEFPSLSWLDESAEDAFAGIISLVADILDDMAAAGEQPPIPLTMRSYSGRFQVRVTPETHRRLVIEAAEAHVSLNRLVASRL